jgi:hypothetical protein
MKRKGIPRVRQGQAGMGDWGWGTEFLSIPFTPTNLHRYQKKGVTEFAFCKWLTLKDMLVG